MQPILIRFPPELLARLKAQSAAKGVPLAELIRYIMEQWLDRKLVLNQSTIDTKPQS